MEWDEFAKCSSAFVFCFLWQRSCGHVSGFREKIDGFQRCTIVLVLVRFCGSNFRRDPHTTL